ncbi:hypothetical protein HU200_005553 [Digitaria exilis]|uniref:BHLH domain-containing protein n=1 Tax=Digitaria exilis TaxID=1010633 RepID=A0A835KRD3_9POAL|nr:hypothetical protein HU200_005553 [Digitaria exilis]
MRLSSEISASSPGRCDPHPGAARSDGRTCLPPGGFGRRRDRSIGSVAAHPGVTPTRAAKAYPHTRHGDEDDVALGAPARGRSSLAPGSFPLPRALILSCEGVARRPGRQGPEDPHAPLLRPAPASLRSARFLLRRRGGPIPYVHIAAGTHPRGGHVDVCVRCPLPRIIALPSFSYQAAATSTTPYTTVLGATTLAHRSAARDLRRRRVVTGEPGQNIRGDTRGDMPAGEDAAGTADSIRGNARQPTVLGRCERDTHEMPGRDTGGIHPARPRSRPGASRGSATIYAGCFLKGQPSLISRRSVRAAGRGACIVVSLSSKDQTECGLHRMCATALGGPVSLPQKPSFVLAPSPIVLHTFLFLCPPDPGRAWTPLPSYASHRHTSARSLPTLQLATETELDRIVHKQASLPRSARSPPLSIAVASITGCLDDPGWLRRIISPSPTTTMSSRRSRASVSEEEINELISRLQTLLPNARRRGGSQRRLQLQVRRRALQVKVVASTTKLLKETCSYIKSLHREVDDLSDRLSDLMATMDHNSPGAEIIRSLLR